MVNSTLPFPNSYIEEEEKQVYTDIFLLKRTGGKKLGAQPQQSQDAAHTAQPH